MVASLSHIGRISILDFTVGIVVPQVLLGLVVMRVLFGVMIRYSGGLTGPGTNWAVVILAVGVIAFKQVVLASVGADFGEGLVEGAMWFNPIKLFMYNLPVWIGMVGGLFLFKDGTSICEWFGYG